MKYIVAELERIGHNVSDVIFCKRSPSACERLGCGNVMSHLANSASIRNANIGKMHWYTYAFKEIVHPVNALLCYFHLRQVTVDTKYVYTELYESRQCLLVQDMLHPSRSDNC